MSQRYEVQGRVVERRSGVIHRDEARRAAADSLPTATAIARTFVADGFDAWIFVVERAAGRTAPVYRTLDHLRPARVSEPACADPGRPRRRG